MPRPRARLDQAGVAAAFAADGLHGVSGAEVARRAGVAKPTVYARGGSKEGLFFACVEAEVERLLSLLSDAEQAHRDLPARARLTALAAAVIDHVIDQPEAARLLHQTARHRSSAVAGAVDAALARLPARVALLLRSESTPESAEQVAVALVGAAAAVGFTRPRDSAAAAAMLGAAFAAVLEASPPPTVDAVQSVGLY